MDETMLNDFEEPKGMFDRLKERFSLGPDEDEDMDLRGGKRKPITLRLHSARVSRVSVWHAAEDFDTAQLVADGLKQGNPQVVNLENATPEMAERIIDFLNGVTYALEGSVEKVGHKVFFFTPHNMVIEVEEKNPPRARGFFAGN